MSYFSEEVRRALRQSGVPVAGRHPYGAVVKALPDGDVWILFRAVSNAFVAELIEETSYALRTWGWRYTHVARKGRPTITVHRGGRVADQYGGSPRDPHTTPSARPGRGSMREG